MSEAKLQGGNKKCQKIPSTIEKSYLSRSCADFSSEEENGNYECYEISACSMCHYESTELNWEHDRKSVSKRK